MSEEYRIKHNIQPGYKGQYAFVRKKPNPGQSIDSGTESETRESVPRKKVNRVAMTVFFLTVYIPQRKLPTPDIPETSPSRLVQNASQPLTTNTCFDDASQWPIREGNDEPPAWAKNGNKLPAPQSKILTAGSEKTPSRTHADV